MELFKYVEPQLNSSVMPRMWSLNDLFNDLAKIKKKFKFVGNHKYKEIVG